MTTISPVNSNGAGAAADWLTVCLTLRSDLTFDIRKNQNHSFAVIEDPVRSRFFQIGQNEYRFISRIDGKRSVQQIIEQSAKDEQGPLTEELAQTVCNWLVANHFLLMNGDQFVQRLQAVAKSKQTSKSLSKLNPICIKFKLCNPDRFLQRITPGLRWLFSLPAVILWIVAGVVATSQLMEQWERFSNSAAGILAPSRWLWLLLVWVALKFIHEMAHGIVCRKYGGEVKEAGALLLLFAPMAYVDVTSSWRMSNRWQRICVSGAGMYIEMAVAFVAALCWCQLEPGLMSDLCYNVIIMASVTSILFNANPLMRFDGYYILTDLLNVVNLYNRGRDRVWSWVDRWILGMPTTQQVMNRRESTIVAVYGILATVWKVFLTFSLLLGASVLFDGLGLILAAVGGLFWVVMPMLIQAKRILKLIQLRQVSGRRIGIAAAAFCLLLVSVFIVLRAPSVSSVPAIVKLENEQIIRSDADGFLQEILVDDGERVEIGQALLHLANPQLLHEFNAIQSQIQAAQIQARVFRDRDELAKSQAETEKADGLRQKLNEIKSQIDSLQVNSEVAGIVYARGLRNKVGKFFKRGDLLMTIADDQSKLILVSISEDHVETLPNSIGETVRLAMPGMPMVNCILRDFKPRASDRLSELAWSASVGGPLPVRPVQQGSDSELRLVQPRFTAKLSVPKELASKLFAGQTGYALIGSADCSLGSYWIVSIRRWISEKFEQALQINR